MPSCLISDSEVPAVDPRPQPALTDPRSDCGWSFRRNDPTKYGSHKLGRVSSPSGPARLAKMAKLQGRFSENDRATCFRTTDNGRDARPTLSFGTVNSGNSIGQRYSASPT